MSSSAHKQVSQTTFSLWKVLLPVVIGIGVVVILFLRDARQENIMQILDGLQITTHTFIFLFVACLCMIGRDVGLSWRFRALTDHKLRWSQAIKVDLLCEFTSCVTPSAVGGSSFGMVFLNREGIEFGRATTLMFTTLFLDELFFVISCPLVVLFTPVNEIFNCGNGAFSSGIRLTFWLVYSGICIWTAILFIGIIVKPQGIRDFLIKLFHLKWLRRWQPSIIALGDNMIATSKELRAKPFRFWLEVFAGTALSWTSRYLVVNAIFMAFIPGSWADQWVILARQFVVWVVLMVSPTPGGSGLSEWLFTEYYGDFISTAGLALIMAVCWRLISYYVYLLIGAILVPSWLKGTIAAVQSHNNKVSDTRADAASASSDDSGVSSVNSENNSDK